MTAIKTSRIRDIARFRTDATYGAYDIADLSRASVEIETLEGNSRKVPVDELVSSVAAGINLILNPQFTLAQRGASFTSASTPANNDDTYTLDRWILLSDGNDVVDVSQETTTVPERSSTAIKLDVETANKKFGIFQPIKAGDCAQLIGQVASAAFEARAGGSNATVDKLRAAIVSWQGTADSITSDIVSAWGAEGVNPTLAANWTYESTPEDFGLTTSFQQFVIENVSIDTASTKQFGLFIWCDNDDATVADTVFIGNVQLVGGAVAPSEFKARPDILEQLLCFHYYAPMPSWLGAWYETSNTTFHAAGNFFVPMRVAPTATIANGSGAIARPGIAFYDASSPVSSFGIAGGYLTVTTPAAGVGATGNWSSNRVYLDSEL